jgi:carbamate kinase
MNRIAVVAVGGNALTREDQDGSPEQIEENARVMAQGIAGLHREGWRVVVVHGNGPQVGNLAIQQESGAALVPPQPLHSLGAMSQGQLGSILVRGLDSLLGAGTAVAVVSHVTVDPADPAFGAPMKPIGPFFDVERAAELSAERGSVMREGSGRAHRRVVASPRPVEILEGPAIRTLVDDGRVVLACGGGGIGVLAGVEGSYPGVDAVIDKDAAAALLAISLGADALVLVTGVDAVSVDYGTPRARVITEMTVADAERHLGDGQFPPGSMGPKVRSAIDSVQAVGGTTVITSAQHLLDGIDPTSTHRTRLAPTPALRHA